MAARAGTAGATDKKEQHEEALVRVARREIVIDPVRCPLAYEEFRLKEFERDRDGTWADDIPDGNDHSIDAVRYAMMEDVLRGRDGVLDSGRLFSHATGLSTTRGPPRSQYTSRPS